MFIRFFFVFSICLFFYGCSKKQSFSNNVFRYNESSSISSLDPVYAKDQASIWAVSQIFNGLVQFDNNLNIIPCIAKNWIVDSSGTKYTFFLRQDVQFHESSFFHNGFRNVVAYDFVYSFNRIISKDIASPGAWVWNYIQKVYDLNDSTLIIELKDVFSPFLGLLTMPYFFVVPEEVVESGTFLDKPVGTGPFVYKIWKENIRMVFVKNDNYFEEENGVSLPYLDGVAISFVRDKHIAFLNFIKGELDFISGLEPKYKNELLDSLDNVNSFYANDFNFLSQPYLNTEYLGFYMTGENVIPKSLRKAINYSINKKDMIVYLRKGLGLSGDYSIVPPYMSEQYLTPNGYNYNLDSAKKYVAVFKSLNKEVEKPIILYTNSSYLDYCEFIQSECEKTGIYIRIEVMPPSVLRQSISNGKAPFFRASWIADYSDPENYYSLFYSENFSPKGPNYTHFKSLDYDSLYLEALRVNSDSLRFDIYHKMDKILFDECPFVILFYDQIMVFIRKEIKDFYLNPMNFLSLKRVKKTNNLSLQR